MPDENERVPSESLTSIYGELNTFIQNYLALRLRVLFSMLAFVALVAAFGAEFETGGPFNIDLVRTIILFILWGTYFSTKTLEHSLSKRYRIACEEAQKCEAKLAGAALHTTIMEQERGKGLSERVFRNGFKGIAFLLILLTAAELYRYIENRAVMVMFILLVVYYSVKLTLRYIRQ